MLAMQHWAKTQEGLSTIETQRPFCIGGVLWQGWRQTAIEVHEGQLSDSEMQTVIDVDNSMERVWFKRHQRLEGRVQAKVNEYDRRRHTLRQERNEILESIERIKKMDLEPSHDDLDQLARIDKRTAKLSMLSQQESLKLAGHQLGEQSPEEAKEAQADQEIKEKGTSCAECGSHSPASHHNPKMWLRGHGMRCAGRRSA